MDYLKSEHLKFKRTISNKLIFIVPLITAIFAWLMGGYMGYQYMTLYWWYAFLLPGAIAILCSLSHRKEENAGKYYSVFSMPVNLSRFEFAKGIILVEKLLVSAIFLALLISISRERHTALTFDRIKIDLSEKELRVDNTPVALTKSEYLICEYLARNKGQVFSKEQIYEAVFSLEGDSDNSTISTHIKNIRSKLNKLDIQPIATVWGIGYKWE